jgi:hypothetical protein
MTTAVKEGIIKPRKKPKAGYLDPTCDLDPENFDHKYDFKEAYDKKWEGVKEKPPIKGDREMTCQFWNRKRQTVKTALPATWTELYDQTLELMESA